MAAVPRTNYRIQSIKTIKAKNKQTIEVGGAFISCYMAICYGIKWQSCQIENAELGYVQKRHSIK
jgi:hypothetical protein